VCIYCCHYTPRAQSISYLAAGWRENRTVFVPSVYGMENTVVTIQSGTVIALAADLIFLGPITFGLMYGSLATNRSSSLLQATSECFM